MNASVSTPRSRATHGRPLILFLLLAVSIALSACRSDPPPLPPEVAEEREPELLVLVYDRSNSVTDAELQHYQEATRSRLNDLVHGDRLVALQILELSLDEDPIRWSQSVPVREFPDRVMARDSVSRARFLQDARDYLTRFTSSDDREDFQGTDILSTLHLVAAEAAAFPEYRTTVILFSDMLQATAVMNMEGLVRMPPANWIERQAELDVLPDLSGICVVVVGARTDTPASQRVKSFWEEYFQVTGATLLPRNYQYRVVRIPERPCGP